MKIISADDLERGRKSIFSYQCHESEETANQAPIAENNRPIFGWCGELEKFYSSVAILTW